MFIFKVKQICELVISVEKGSSFVSDCSRKAIFTDLVSNKDYDITLRDGDALIPLKVGQHVLADLRWDNYRINGEEKDEYYVISLKTMDQNYKIEFVEDWTIHLD